MTAPFSYFLLLGAIDIHIGQQALVRQLGELCPRYTPLEVLDSFDISERGREGGEPHGW